MPVISPSCMTATRSLSVTISSMSLLIEDDRRALVSEPANEAMDLGLGADVDALRGFIEEHDARLERQPFAEHDLLLISAAECRDRRFDGQALTVSAAAWWLARRFESRPNASPDQDGHRIRVSGNVMFSRTVIAAMMPAATILGDQAHSARMASRGESSTSG